MSFSATTLKRSHLLLFLLGLATLPAAAQIKNSPIVFAQSAITTSFVAAPSFGNSSGDSRDMQWLKVEFHYGVMPLNKKFLDAVEFRIWIEGRDLYTPEAPTDRGIAVGLVGKVTYVNLAAARDAYGSFYVPPATLNRYSTNRGPSDFDRNFNIHIEAYIGGTLVDYFDKNKETDGNWFHLLKPVEGMVYRQDQCPFIVVDSNKYPPIQLPASSTSVSASATVSAPTTTVPSATPAPAPGTP